MTADKFDEAAVYAQAEQIAQQQVKRQVEMARVRNQMYNLLTPQQKSVLDQKHQQRMQQMEQQISGLQQTSAQKLSTTE
ncbi:Periplasmic protein CpxP precursor [compost metagenome]